MTLGEILDDLAFLEDDLERYQYVIDLGRHLPPFPESARTEENKVRGCTSLVWMVGRFSGGDRPRLSLLADADAQIVRGLVALLFFAYEGKSPAEIVALDVPELMARLRFTEQLTPGRQNGLHAMISRVRSLAEAQAHTSAASHPS